MPDPTTPNSSLSPSGNPSLPIDLVEAVRSSYPNPHPKSEPNPSFPPAGNPSLPTGLVVAVCSSYPNPYPNPKPNPSLPPSGNPNLPTDLVEAERLSAYSACTSADPAALCEPGCTATDGRGTDISSQVCMYVYVCVCAQ